MTLDELIADDVAQRAHLFSVHRHPGDPGYRCSKAGAALNLVRNLRNAGFEPLITRNGRLLWSTRTEGDR